MSRVTANVLCEVAAERERQDAKWGEQNHPDGTGCWISSLDGMRTDVNVGAIRLEKAQAAKLLCDSHARGGRLTWKHILDEEVCEAFAEDGEALRRELLQVAAVAVGWIECIDRRAVLQEDANERFERLAEEFRRETGLMAPGKDAPPGLYTQEQGEERQRLWVHWLKERRS